jgi:hypothetical protein
MLLRASTAATRNSSEFPSSAGLAQIESSLIAVYKGVFEYREVPFIRFGDRNVEELANAFVVHPVIVKPRLCCVKVAQRAISRDLDSTSIPTQTKSARNRPESCPATSSLSAADHRSPIADDSPAFAKNLLSIALRIRRSSSAV